MGGACSIHGRYKKCVKIVVGNSREETFGRCRRKWEDNIKIGLKETVARDIVQ
jgi:hypothetical protein